MARSTLIVHQPIYMYMFSLNSFLISLFNGFYLECVRIDDLRHVVHVWFLVVCEGSVKQNAIPAGKPAC